MYTDDPMMIDLIANHKKCQSKKQPSQKDVCTKELNDLFHAFVVSWCKDDRIQERLVDFKEILKSKLDETLTDFNNRRA